MDLSFMNIRNSQSLFLRARRPIRPIRPIRPALISDFISMKRLGVFLLPLGWDASPSQGYPQHFAGTHLYTWVERGTMRVKCLAQEHNTMSPAKTRTRTRTRTRTTRSGVKRTNHETTVPPQQPNYAINKSVCNQSAVIRTVAKAIKNGFKGVKYNNS